MSFVEARDLTYEYEKFNEEGEVTGSVPALRGVTLSVEKGSFVVILGHNGSGKSTFAKHLNVLLKSSGGTLTVNGYDAAEEKNLWQIRESVGMVFQNPDNQLVAGVVEEDVAFGPENIGLPREEIEERITEALAAVDMERYRMHSPNLLSGGQKQRIAVAGVVAMRPDCMIFDESTAMLDPKGRGEVLETAQRLNREHGVTILWITHYMEEAVEADQVFVMEEGRVTMQGTPREIFRDAARLEALGLAVPQMTRLAGMLSAQGVPLPEAVLNRGELEEALDRIRENRTPFEKAAFEGCHPELHTSPGTQNSTAGTQENRKNPAAGTQENRKKSETGMQNGENGQEPEKEPPVLSCSNLTYTYDPGGPYESHAVRGVSLALCPGSYNALIGPTGSGKSTLLSLLGGLLRPQSGSVCYGDRDIYKKGVTRRELCSGIGLVFQYPEYQLFETTVIRDAAYGPKNLGMSEREAEEAAGQGLMLAGMPEETWEKSPFELSGGEKRRAAIAGVLAMKPKVLILDEPAAGLDPKGRRELYALLRDLHAGGMTILLVSHSMEDAAEEAERILVFEDGSLRFDGTPQEVFSHGEALEAMGLGVPETIRLTRELCSRGMEVCPAVTPEDAVREILHMLYAEGETR